MWLLLVGAEKSAVINEEAVSLGWNILRDIFSGLAYRQYGQVAKVAFQAESWSWQCVWVANKVLVLSAWNKIEQNNGIDWVLALCNTSGVPQSEARGDHWVKLQFFTVVEFLEY